MPRSPLDGDSSDGTGTLLRSRPFPGSVAAACSGGGGGGFVRTQTHGAKNKKSFVKAVYLASRRALDGSSESLRLRAAASTEFRTTAEPSYVRM